jgi:hypothetical protein
MSGWLREFVEDRRARARDDLASALVHATTDDGAPALSTSETVTMIGTILSAGSSTTDGLINSTDVQPRTAGQRRQPSSGDPAGLRWRASRQSLVMAMRPRGRQPDWVGRRAVWRPDPASAS